jgi:hypothetical protein
MAKFRQDQRALAELHGGTTSGGQDKSRQGAARLGYCFYWVFSPFRQGAPLPRHVRADIKFLFSLSFPHIAGAGDVA